MLETNQNKKLGKRKKALDRLVVQLESGKKMVKDTIQPLTPADVSRIKQEITNLEHYLSGKKKPRKRKLKEGEIEQPQGDKYWIEIFSISFSTIKRSDRRKNKGKSRKKMRIQRSVTFVKKVVMQPGLLQKYRQGIMGISPRNHSFRVKKDEEFTYN